VRFILERRRRWLHVINIRLGPLYVRGDYDD
jgi:hypothetical protein